MISVNGNSDIELQISALKEAVGARNDAQLADFIGASRNAVSLWRKRNSIPESARRRVASLARYGVNARAMDERRIALGHQIMYEGLCLALFLAPARETSGSRFSSVAYGGILRNYASLFSEIHLACAEEVAERLSQIEGNAADAMASLAGGDAAALYDRVLERAMAWNSDE